MLTAVKLIISAGMIYVVNEVVIRHNKTILGSLIASLPLVTLITFVWIHYGLKTDPEARVEKLATHSTGVFWFVLPTLPMFLIFPALLRRGLSFWPSLIVCCVVTMALYAAMAFFLKRFGLGL